MGGSPLGIRLHHAATATQAEGEGAGPRRPGVRGQGSETSTDYSDAKLARNPRGGHGLWVECSRRGANSSGFTPSHHIFLGEGVAWSRPSS